jgi:hypothetical protein
VARDAWCAGPGDASAFAVGGITDIGDLRGFAANVLEDEAESIEAEHGPAVAREFAGIARGTATPILLHMDAWLREGGVKGPLNPRTAAQYRSDLKAIAARAKSASVATVEGFTNVVAGRFVTEQRRQRLPPGDRKPQDHGGVRILALSPQARGHYCRPVGRPVAIEGRGAPGGSVQAPVHRCRGYGPARG